MGILDSPSFRGRSAAKLDAKGRLRIPAKFREVLQKHYTDTLIVSKREDRLVAYPPEKWDEMETKVGVNLSQFNSDHQSFVRNFISGAEICEFDTQGRILIPPVLREEAHLNQDLILVGMLSSFEIWNKAAYDLQAAQYRENETKIIESIASTGL